jgi:hypothetical protein
MFKDDETEEVVVVHEEMPIYNRTIINDEDPLDSSDEEQE